MNFSDDWRSLWPISAVFSAPNLLSGHHSRPLGPLLFRPSSPSLPLLSSPALNLSLPAPLPSAALLDGLHNFFRSSSNAAFLPYSAVADLAADLLPSSPDDPLPSNTLAALRSRRDPSSLLLFFPSGDNAHFISYFSLDIKAPPPPPPPSPPELFEQRQGFKHPYHRISKLYVAPAAASDWESSDDEDVVEGFLIATTMYSVNWFRVENRILGSAEQGGQQRLNLVPVAKQGFESCVADACFSPHFPEESAVLLESGELCWFNLDTMHGGMVEVRLDGDNPGGWFGCKYGSQPWILVVACSAAVLLVDLRGKRSGEAKVLARVEMPGMFGVTRLLEGDWFTAFCKAGYNDFHFSVVTRTQLLLFDSRQPLVPVLMWDHGLICPSFVGMYRLSELRPSEEFKWASESGFAILVGSFWNDEFNLFCYGPREGGANGKSALYAWELPSALPLSGRCAFGDNAIKQELSKDDLVNGGELRRNDLVVGFYIVPNDLLRLDSEVSNIRGFALIRLMSSGKLEVQKYNASWDSCYEKSNDSGKDLKQTEFPIYSVAQEEQISTEYHFYKFQDLCAYMNGDLSSTLDIHDQHFNLKGNGQCFMHSEVRELMTDKLKSSSLSPSAFISEVTIPTSIFEIALRRVLTCNNMPHLAFSKYSEIFGSKCRLHFEFLDVPSCLPHHSLPPFFLVKPSRRSDKWLKKTSPGKALVGPVLPIPILLTLQQMDKGRDSSIVLKEASDGDLFSLECKTILENVFPEISIADTETASCAWSGSQEIQDEKPFFVYKPIFLDSLSTQKNSCYSSGHPIKEELPEINKKDHLLMNGKAAYNDENFTTFICGVADKTSSSDSKSDMAGDKLSQLFDVSPVRYVLLGNHCDAWTFGAVDPNSGTATLLEKALTDPQLVCTTSVTEYWKPLADDVYCWKGLHFLAKQDLGGFSRFTDHGIEGIVPRELLPPDVQSKFHAKPSEKTK